MNQLRKSYSYFDTKTSILENRPTETPNRFRRVNKGLGDPTPTKCRVSVHTFRLSSCNEMSTELRKTVPTTRRTTRF